MLCVRGCILGLVALLLCMSTGSAGEMRTHTEPGLGDYTEPFYADGSYNSSVQSPSEFLGFELGARPAKYEEIVAYFRYLSDNFANVGFVDYAVSYEGRDLIYLTVTSEDNARRLREIRQGIAKIADPRVLGDGDDVKQLIADSPAIAWMAYGIHGDELSSCDAALQLAYQLVAGTDEITRLIRDEVVVCIDPSENPDGRMRWIKQLEQWNSVVPSPDIQSLHHTGFWPYGRGNHYLFDLNRDWFAQVHPESRGRVDAITKWNPQYLLDCHEMGPTNTYMFSPPREPFNPYMISQIHKWWEIYAKDQAAAFDRYGWSYYTREWNEELFPGYGSSWGIYIGAIGMLYEQAGVDGSFVKRPDGTIMTYRETVHHQFTSSMANLATTAKHREELLRDFHEEKRRAVGLSGDRSDRFSAAAFVFPPTANRSRLLRFAETLERQAIEVEVAATDFQLGDATSHTGDKRPTVSAPKGSLVVKVSQPMRALVEAIMTYDIRIPNDFLKTQRRERIKNDNSRLYESTGWSLPIAYNLESYYVDKLPKVETRRFDMGDYPNIGGLATTGDANFGYAFSNADDAAFGLLARLLERGHKVWAAKEPFQVGDRRFERGSFVIRMRSNPDLAAATLTDLAVREGVGVYPVSTALGGKLADLGGDQFELLRAPRVAIVGGANVSAYEFGALWHMLDSRLRFRVTTLDVNTLARRDLRKYNVIVLPGSWFGGVYDGALGKRGLENLKTWIEAGGTLVAMGNGAVFCADSSNGLSSVRSRRQVLAEIDKYDYALERLRLGEAAEFDSLDLWEAKKPKVSEEAEKSPAPSKSDIDRADELARTLQPRGAILAVDLDPKHWLAYGERSPVPALVYSSHAFVSKEGVQVAGRFAPQERLRLSGLLWPEARARWSDTAYATREGRGSGQIILFAGQPNFRAYFHGGERLLLNAVFLGPGFGTNPGIDW